MSIVFAPSKCYHGFRFCSVLQGKTHTHTQCAVPPTYQARKFLIIIVFFQHDYWNLGPMEYYIFQFVLVPTRNAKVWSPRQQNVKGQRRRKKEGRGKRKVRREEGERDKNKEKRKETRAKWKREEEYRKEKRITVKQKGKEDTEERLSHWVPKIFFFVGFVRPGGFHFIPKKCARTQPKKCLNFYGQGNPVFQIRCITRYNALQLINATFLTAWSDTLLIEPGNNTPGWAGVVPKMKSADATVLCLWTKRCKHNTHETVVSKYTNRSKYVASHATMHCSWWTPPFWLPDRTHC